MENSGNALLGIGYGAVRLLLAFLGPPHVVDHHRTCPHQDEGREHRDERRGAAAGPFAFLGRLDHGGEIRGDRVFRAAEAAGDASLVDVIEGQRGFALLTDEVLEHGEASLPGLYPLANGLSVWADRAAAGAEMSCARTSCDCWSDGG